MFDVIGLIYTVSEHKFVSRWYNEYKISLKYAYDGMHPIIHTSLYNLSNSWSSAQFGINLVRPF